MNLQDSQPGDGNNAPTRDFAHAGSLESINDILANGLNTAKARRSSRGGSVNRPGSFFTVEVTPTTFSIIAADLISFGMRHSHTPVLLVLEIPTATIEDFEARGIVERRVWGEYTETIFMPDTYPEINQGVRMVQLPSMLSTNSRIRRKAIMGKYDGLEDKIVVRNWPRVYENTAGKWQRVWDIVLTEKVADDVDCYKAQQALSTDEVSIGIASNERYLQVTVTTDRWGWDDDLIWYSYDILKGINDFVGEIETIQGQPRSEWRPWHTGENE